MLIVSLSGFLLLFTSFRVVDPIAVIEIDGHEVGRMSLNREQRVNVDGPLGTTVVDVRGRKAAIVQSPCPHQICVRTGWIGRRGAITACIPNRIIVRIVGGEETGVDAITK